MPHTWGRAARVRGLAKSGVLPGERTIHPAHASRVRAQSA